MGDGDNLIIGQYNTGTKTTRLYRSGQQSRTAFLVQNQNWTAINGQGIDGNGIFGESQSGNGVLGTSISHVGVYGLGSANGAFGVVGRAPNAGVAAFNSNNTHAAYLASDCCAAWFTGDVVVTGTLTKAGGGFEIDHPLDPGGKLLTHSFVESSDRKNVYDGLTRLDAKGEATVKLPTWFEAVNRDCRYQLTAVGGPAPNLHIARKMKAGQFRIAGGKPGLEISWQVTGIRRDLWARAHPLVVEKKKLGGEKGYYLDPTLYGMPQEKSVGRKRHPESSKNGREMLKRPSKASGGTKLRKHRT